MENLDDEIAQAQAKLDELRRKKIEEEERKKKESLKATIHSFVVSSGRISISLTDFHPEVVEILRRVPGRVYDGNRNIIPAIELENIIPLISPIMSIVWDKPETKEKFDEWINQPDLTLKLQADKSRILILLGPKMIEKRLYLTDQIQSLSYNSIARNYSLSLAEGYKFPSIIEKQYPKAKIHYEGDLKEIITKQAERIQKLMEVANAEDAPDVPNPFTGINPTTNERFDLKPHQRVAIKFAQLNNFRSLIAYDMGGGKTPIGIAASELGGFKKILIICPAPLKKNWQKEIKKFVGKDAMILSGSHPEAWQIDDIIKGKYQYYIINYDIMSRSEISDKDEENGKEDSVNKWAMVINLAGFNLFIVDESHRIKNMDSKRSKAVRALNMPHVLPLSGTPIVNRPGELFPTLNIIAREEFNNESAFLSQFTYRDGTPKNVKQLHETLGHYMIRRTWEQIYGKNLDPNRIPFTKELSPKAREHYQRVLAGIYISLRRPNYQSNVTSILAELTRCKQICSADNVETSADLAIEAWEETGKKVIIFSQFIDSQADIHKILGNSSKVINGTVPDDRRYEIIEEFQKPESDTKFIITNILEGLTMTAAWTTIFNDLWWTPKDHRQAEGRAFGRVNDPHSGNSYYIQNENTIDEFIVALLEKKLATFKEVIDGTAQHQEMEKSLVSELINHLKNSI